MIGKTPRKTDSDVERPWRWSRARDGGGREPPSRAASRRVSCKRLRDGATQTAPTRRHRALGDPDGSLRQLKLACRSTSTRSSRPSPRHRGAATLAPAAPPTVGPRLSESHGLGRAAARPATTPRAPACVLRPSRGGRADFEEVQLDGLRRPEHVQLVRHGAAGAPDLERPGVAHLRGRRRQGEEKARADNAKTELELDASEALGISKMIVETKLTETQKWALLRFRQARALLRLLCTDREISADECREAQALGFALRAMMGDHTGGAQLDDEAKGAIAKLQSSSSRIARSMGPRLLGDRARPQRGGPPAGRLRWARPTPPCGSTGTRSSSGSRSAAEPGVRRSGRRRERERPEHPHIQPRLPRQRGGAQQEGVVSAPAARAGRSQGRSFRRGGRRAGSTPPSKPANAEGSRPDARRDDGRRGGAGRGEALEEARAAAEARAASARTIERTRREELLLLLLRAARACSTSPASIGLNTGWLRALAYAACAPRRMRRACARGAAARVPPLSHPHAPQVSASESPGHVASSHDVAGDELSAEEQQTSARACTHSDYTNSDYQSSDTASEAGAEVADEAANPAADPADDSELDDVGVKDIGVLGLWGGRGRRAPRRGGRRGRARARAAARGEHNDEDDDGGGGGGDDDGDDDDDEPPPPRRRGAAGAEQPAKKSGWDQVNEENRAFAAAQAAAAAPPPPLRSSPRAAAAAFAPC